MSHIPSAFLELINSVLEEDISVSAPPQHPSTEPQPQISDPKDNQARGRPVGSHREDGIPQQPIASFKPRHMEVIRRLITGQTQREIAREMGYTESRLSIIVNSPLFQHKLKEQQKAVGEKLVDTIANVENQVRLLQPEAVDTLSEIMRKKGNDRLRRDCAKDLLDIGGNIGKKRDEEGMNDFARIIADAFKQAQGKVNDPNIINVTPEEPSEPDTTDDIPTTDEITVEVQLEEEVH